MYRLDRHGDQFRTACLEVETKPEVIVRPPRAGGKTQAVSKQTDKQNAGGAKKPGPKRKSKADKVLLNEFLANPRFYKCNLLCNLLPRHFSNI